MVSNNQRKQILQLKQKKHRLVSGLFVAEGEKVVEEFLNASWECVLLFSINAHFHPKAVNINVIVMKQITHFKSPSPILGVFKFPNSTEASQSDITIAVDGIRDPGNLGTLIRLCDWFGLSELICSNTTVDCYNSKVVQASMGSITRVQCRYEEDLGATLEQLKKPIYGADLDGKSLYISTFPKQATFVFGSESHGISAELNKKIDHKILIPNFRKGRGAESLNVATASAIFLSEIFRGR
ncbi:MAG: TrmH family RNA methyltransferase [Flavobacteriaceae bacterium]|jgi:TrmH family RNA methyltransferase|tara:strand:- start:302 stop:1021 length:720 start_codon:yes stop_codon:yes gene_type:complete